MTSYIDNPKKLLSTVCGWLERAQNSIFYSHSVTDFKQINNNYYYKSLASLIKVFKQTNNQIINIYYQKNNII